MKEQTPTVYIVDDDLEWCASLKWLLDSVNINTAIFNDGFTFLDSYQTNHRGCILLDIRMPLMSGLQIQEQLNTRSNKMPIIIISGHADVPLATRAMKAGAFDFMTKPVHDDQLLEIIYAALKVDEQQYHLFKDINYAQYAHRFSTLSPREREILDLVILGKMNKQIAAELAISIKTVEIHRANLMKKLQVKNLADLIKIYLLFNR